VPVLFALQTGYAEFSKKSCSNIIDAFCVFCYQEKCCRLREWVKCCPKLDCVKELAGCPSVPLQEASHTWESSIFYTKLADGGSVVFPFYRVSEVPEGGDCESERSLGACSCADGKKMPGGCNAQDSSTWAVWNGTAASAESLPAGLSLTCAPKPPPPAAGPAGSEGQASAGVPSEAPGADGEGDGARGAGDADAAESGSEADTHSDETGPKKEGEGTAAEGAAASESEASESEQEGARGGPGAYTGTVVAASIVSAMTAAAIVTGIAVACKRRQRKKSHVRTSEAYEAMLTGTSYTPPIKAKAPLMSLVQRAFQRVIGRKQPDFQPSLDTLEDGSALQEPAAPADDEIFTVRDLAQNEGNQRAKKWHKRSVHTMGKEMEMQEQAHLLQQSLAKMSKPDITTYELPLQSREGSERVEEFVDGADEGERPRTPPPTGGGQRRGDPDTYHRD